MAEETLKQQQSAYSGVSSGTSTGGSTPTPPSIFPTGGPPSPLNMPNLRGRARFENLVRTSAPKAGLYESTEDTANFVRWAYAQADDPGDAEYQALLNKARNGERPWINPFANIPQRGQKPTGDQGDGEVVKTMFKRHEDFPNTTNFSNEDEEVRALKKEQREWEKAKAKVAKNPLFIGHPGEEAEAAGETIEDDYIAKFMQNNGIMLDPDDAEKKMSSGLYVYMGKNTNNPYGVGQDMYVYEKDAKALLWNVNSAKLAKYQKALGMEVTGKPDPKLQDLWDYAVYQAGQAAKTGRKVSVEELFDVYTNAVISQKNKSGGGGGGGGAQTLTTDDYYFAMMSVLGDISGVEG